MSQIHWTKQVSFDFATAADWTGGHVPGSGDDAILDAPGSTAYTVTSSSNHTVSSIQMAATATLAISGGVFSATKGSGSGVNAGAIVVGDGAALSLGGTLANTGSVTLDSGGDATGLRVSGALVLSGGGKLILDDQAANSISGTSATAVLTNVDNTISGAGQIGNSLSLVNQAKGVIDATGTQALAFETGSKAITNAGLIETTGSGGLMIAGETINNAGGTILAAAGSQVDLSAGTVIKGGTIATAGSGLMDSVSGGATLDGTVGGLANTGAVTIGDDNSLTLLGTIANSGTISVVAVSAPSDLAIGPGSVTLTGHGLIFLAGPGDSIGGSGPQSTLVNLDNTIAGSGSIGGSGLTLLNKGVIDQTGASSLNLGFGSVPVTNAGMIEATGAAGLTVAAETINNAGGTILAATGSQIDLSAGAVIEGGTLATTGSGVILDASGGATLDGTAGSVANMGALTVADDNSLTLLGTIANSGVITLASQGDVTALVVGSAGLTLSGAGQVILSDTSANSVSGASATSTLTNVDNTISGAGQLGGGKLTLVNGAKGVINGVGGNTFALNTGAATITNAGLIEASGAGGVAIQSAVTNSGALEGAGSGALILQNAAVTDTATGIVAALKGGHVSVQAASITGGAVTIAAGGLLSVDGGGKTGASTLAAATATNQGAITIDDNTSLTAQGTIANKGVITVNTVGDATALIVGTGNLTLNGGGQLILTDSVANTVTGAGAAATLTNVDNTIGGAGQLGGGKMTLANGAKGVINGVGGNTLVVNTGAASITNAGLIEASGAGGVIIQSAVANSGALEGLGSGALVLQNAVVTNSTAGIVAAVKGGHVSLQAASISGGAVTIAAGGLLSVDGGGKTGASTLAAATTTNLGAITIDDNTSLTAQGTLLNKCAVTVNTAGDATALIVGSGNLTLTGAGQLILTDSTANSVVGASAAATLTNVDNIISGGGSLGGGQMTLINQIKGVINANAANTLTLDTAGRTAINAGLIEGTGSGGLNILNTTVNNVGGTIQAVTGARVLLQGADIQGGALQTSGTGAIVAVAASTLDGAASSLTNLGAVVINDNVSLTVQGAIVNKGTISLNSAGDATGVTVGAAKATLSGGGKLVLSDTTANLIIGASATASLTNTDNTISGAGQIGGGKMILINAAKGVINATGANTLTVNTGAATITNVGLVEATGQGGLVVQSAVANTGVLEGAGPGALTLQNATVTGSGAGSVMALKGGHVSLQAGGISGGAVTIAAGGLLSVDGGGKTGVSNLAATTTTNLGAIAIDDNTTLTAQGTIANTGVITVNTGGDATALIVGTGNLTLAGGGQLILTDSAANSISGATSAATLTNVDNTISGGGSLGGGKMTLVNQAKGVINGNAFNTLVLDTVGRTVTNGGLIEATGSGGLAIVSTVVNNSTGGSLSVGDGSAMTFHSTTIIGGVLAASGMGHGVFQTNDSGSILDGSASAVRVNATVDISDNTALTLKGAINDTGTIVVGSAGDATNLIIGANTTLTGGGSVILSDSAANSLYGAAATTTLTNNDLILGAGQLGAGKLTLVNQAAGIVNASGFNALVISLGAGKFTNAGLVEATGSGGLDIVKSTINSGAAGVVSVAGASQIDLQSATLAGGTIMGAGLIQTVDSASVLDGSASQLVNNSQVTINDNTALTLKGAIANAGAVLLNDRGDGTKLIVSSAGATLSGAGLVTLDDSAANRIVGGSLTATLTNVDNMISGSGDIGGGGLTLANQAKGVINASGNNALILDTGKGVVSNGGLIEATGQGGLTLLNDTVDDSSGGRISVANNSIVNLIGATVIGGGLIGVGSGVLQTSAAGNGSTLDGEHATVLNSATVDVVDGSLLNIEGVINNTGVIALLGNGGALSDLTALEVVDQHTTLAGVGEIALSDNAENLIISSVSGATLTNAGNLITGAGQIGAGLSGLTLVNGAGGVIESGSGSNALVLNTAANSITNAGLIEGLGAGGLEIESDIVNTGTLEAGIGSTLNLGPFSDITVSNIGGTILATGSTEGQVILTDVAVAGGTLATTGAGVITVTGAASALDGTSSRLTNSGALSVGDAATLTIEGAIKNTGVLTLASTGDATELHVSGYAVLSGGGQVVLSDNQANKITGDGLNVYSTFINVDNTISGSGEINGNAGPISQQNSMVLVNQALGVIDGNSADFHALTLDTGVEAIFNAGLIEATGNGEVVVDSAVNNRGGVLEANGGYLVLGETVTNDGSVIIAGTGSLYLAADSVGKLDVQFAPGSGDLTIENSVTYRGAISGFSTSGATSIELQDITFSSATFSFSGTTTSGVLTVSDGTHMANLNLTGNYTGATFKLAQASFGSDTVVTCVKSGGASVPHFAAAMASFGASGAALAPGPNASPATASTLLATPAHGG